MDIATATNPGQASCSCRHIRGAHYADEASVAAAVRRSVHGHVTIARKPCHADLCTCRGWTPRRP